MSKAKEDQPEINEEEEEVEAAESPVKKGRGRPKGVKNPPKRGRGRPAAPKKVEEVKEVKEVEEVAEEDGEGDAPPPAKKGRGRPRTKPQKVEEPKDPNAPKRGRGRPPKQAKGRGRPPKVVAPVEDDDEEAEDEAAE